MLKRMPLRKRCSFQEASKARFPSYLQLSSVQVGRVVEKGQLLHVVKRFQVGATSCLQLEGGDWLVDLKDDGCAEGPLEVRRMHNEEAEVRASDAIVLRKGPTELPWAITKKALRMARFGTCWACLEP